MISLYGAVLVGGKGTRIGGDKSLITMGKNYPWQEAMSLLDNFCDQVFISCRKDQSSRFGSDHSLIVDQYDSHGPAGALLSLIRKNREMAWLILPCDLPEVRYDIIKKLVEERRTEKDFSAVYNLLKKDVEPLISIWEPQSYEAIISFHENGEYSLRKYLQRLDGHYVSIADQRAFTNINTIVDLQEYNQVKNGLREQNLKRE